MALLKLSDQYSSRLPQGRIQPVYGIDGRAKLGETIEHATGYRGMDR
jgi:hypothetical protein